MEHPSGIPEKIVRKVVARRGRLHAFPTLVVRRTALVVIDLDQATVGEADDQCRRMIPAVNAVATAVRAGGGVVAWVLSKAENPSANLIAILGPALAAQHAAEMRPNGPRLMWWPDCDRGDGDLDAFKSVRAPSFPANAISTSGYSRSASTRCSSPGR